MGGVSPVAKINCCGNDPVRSGPLSLHHTCSSTNDFSSRCSKNQSADMYKESLPDIMKSPERLTQLLRNNNLIFNVQRRFRPAGRSKPSSCIFYKKSDYDTILKLCKRIFCRITNARRLVVSDFIYSYTDVFEYFV